MKLHLCCGNVHLPGWRNIDARYQPAVDVVDNCFILQHYEPASIEEIYCCHGLDHADRWTYKTVLKRWFDLLAPGGVLRISTPDFRATLEYYALTGDLGGLQGQLYASQDYDGNCRKWAWDFPLATRDLEGVGFQCVARYDAHKFLESLNQIVCWMPSNLQPHPPTAPTDCSIYCWGTNDGGTICRSLNITARKPE